jgi:phage portal protein BeeE
VQQHPLGDGRGGRSPIRIGREAIDGQVDQGRLGAGRGQPGAQRVGSILVRGADGGRQDVDEDRAESEDVGAGIGGGGAPAA